MTFLQGVFASCLAFLPGFFGIYSLIPDPDFDSMASLTGGPSHPLSRSVSVD